jgi:hypothetical protein
VNTRKGWAWGTTTGGEWLTIAGSHWAAPLLAESREDAVPYPANIINSTPVLALVENLGYPYYRIVEIAEEAK